MYSSLVSLTLKQTSYDGIYVNLDVSHDRVKTRETIML